MAQTQSLVDQSVDRVQDAIKNVDKEFQRIQRQVKSQRRTIERRIGSQRKSLEKQAEKQLRALRKNDLVKRVETLGSDVQSQIESGVESVLAMLQIASRSDLERVDRKLNRISKKLKDLEASPQA